MYLWYGGFNNNSYYYGIYLLKYGLFGLNFLFIFLERIDIYVREVVNRLSYNFIFCYIGKSSIMFGIRLEYNFKVVRDEELFFFKVVINEDEFFIKKMKMIFIGNE